MCDRSKLAVVRPLRAAPRLSAGRGLRRGALGVLLASSLGAVSPLFAATYYVGSGAGCHYATLEAAITAAASGDALRLEGKTFSNTTGSCTNFNITGKSLTLIGGYAAACNGTLAATRTVLAGAPGCADSVLEIGGSSSERFIQLIGVDLTGGGNDADGGGGLDIRDNSQVTLDDVGIYANESSQGGGIDIDGGFGATLTLRTGTSVTNNQATSAGGGVFCSNGATITFASALILDNFAEHGGGGVFAEDCTLATSTNPSLYLGANVTNSSGGGMWLLQSQVVLDAGATGEIVFSNNEANSEGGGLYVNQSQVTLRSAQLVDNRAQDGGAAMVESGTLRIERSGTTGRVPEVVGNDAEDGGALWIGSEGGIAHLLGVVVAFNVGELGAVIKVDDGLLNAVNTVLLANGPNFTGALVESASGQVFVTNVTTLNNAVDSVISAAAGSTLRVYSSVFDEGLGTTMFASHPAGSDLACLAVPPGATLPPGVNGSYFVYSGLGPDLIHLWHGSALVDRCSPTHCASVDFDGQARPHGPACDIGADEVVPIFVDGFESGNTNAWS